MLGGKETASKSCESRAMTVDGEIRNSKQYRMIKIQMFEKYPGFTKNRFRSFGHLYFEFVCGVRL